MSKTLNVETDTDIVCRSMISGDGFRIVHAPGKVIKSSDWAASAGQTPTSFSAKTKMSQALDLLFVSLHSNECSSYKL